MHCRQSRAQPNHRPSQEDSRLEIDTVGHPLALIKTITGQIITPLLSPGQAIVRCQRNILQHCWAKHVVCVWPRTSAPSCDHFGRHGEWKKYLATKILAKVANWRPTDLHVKRNLLENYQKYLTYLINSSSGGITCLSLSPLSSFRSRMRKHKMSCGSKWQI